MNRFERLENLYDHLNDPLIIQHCCQQLHIPFADR